MMLRVLSFLFILHTTSQLQTVSESAQLIAQGITVVDVRTTEEFSAGALPGALNIPVTDLSFPFQIAKLDKQKPVLIYCKAGGRSARAALAMKALGFSVIYELEGGYRAWEAQKD